MIKNDLFFQRVIHALRGIWVTLKEEQSLRTQAIIGVIVLAIAVWKRVNPLWLALLVTLICLVWAFEIVNSAIENLCDLIDSHYSERIKKIKDMAAGAVLLMAITALMVLVLYSLN